MRQGQEKAKHIPWVGVCLPFCMIKMQGSLE
jgi:hypothetical protein